MSNYCNTPFSLLRTPRRPPRTCTGSFGAGGTCVRRPSPEHDTSSRRRCRRRVVLAPPLGGVGGMQLVRVFSKALFTRTLHFYRFPLFLSFVGGARFRNVPLFIIRQDRRSQSVTGSLNHPNLAT